MKWQNFEQKFGVKTWNFGAEIWGKNGEILGQDFGVKRQNFGAEFFGENEI